jgi:hypothetical protein
MAAIVIMLLFRVPSMCLCLELIFLLHRLMTAAGQGL